MTFDDIVDLAEKAGCDVSAMDGREYQAMWCDSSQLERFAASLIQAGASSRDDEIAFLITRASNRLTDLGNCDEERDKLSNQVAMLRKHLSLAIIGLDESWEELNESRVELMRVAIAETEPK